MKKTIPVVIAIAFCLLLAACGKAGTADAEKSPAAPASTESDARQNGQSARPSGEKTYNFAHAPEIYANPDAYRGKVYASLFQIIGGKQQFEKKSVYYAAGYVNGDTVKTYTLFSFKGSVPNLADGDIIYASGTIEGKGAFLDEAGKSTDVLLLNVESIEYDAKKAGIKSVAKEYQFKSGTYKVKSGSLSLELVYLKFTKDELTMGTKTVDSSLKEKKLYLFDIVLHQNGIFAWYRNCNFQMEPNNMESFETIPFPPLDSAKDITMEFVPYSEGRKLLYEPLSIDAKPNKLAVP
jgi:hypothetical protein